MFLASTGLTALDELQQPLTPYISTAVIPWVCQKIAVLKAQEEPWPPISCCGAVAAIFPAKNLQIFSNSSLPLERVGFGVF
ncbi:MAG: hypothetical protein D6676_00680 [Cyanobacteria bacterium J003]|jgi:hypothetical protein|nr:MAG: hypothetical protein D6676_00680 [Cyanobacteria bacterium J003]